MTMWTKQDYERWLHTRGLEGMWAIEDCRAADALIRIETLRAFRVWVEANVPDRAVRDYLQLMARHHYGSAETDEMLTALRCYPDWMDRS